MSNNYYEAGYVEDGYVIAGDQIGSYFFDGENKIIQLIAGTTSIDLVELWSAWKDWVLLGNAVFLRALDYVGGEYIDEVAGTRVPLYLFLQNGWQIRPQESSHVLRVTGGILLVQGGGDPFADTVGTFKVRIVYSQPVQGFGYSTGGAAAGLTVEQEQLLTDIAKLDGLVPGMPLEVDDTNGTRKAGDITQTIVTLNGKTTVTRV